MKCDNFKYRHWRGECCDICLVVECSRYNCNKKLNVEDVDYGYIFKDIDMVIQRIDIKDMYLDKM